MRIRARSFGSAVDVYEQSRPTYPSALIEHVLADFPGGRMVEVGAGTGKATRLFAAHGVDLTCLEPDPAMASKLAQVCRDQPHVEVVVEAFEDIADVLTEGPVNGLVCAQAWHWTDPLTRWDRAARSLAAEGLLALFWNVEQWGNSPAHLAVEKVFADHGQTITDDGGLSPADWPATRLAEHGGFHDVQVRTYHWSQRLTAAEFIAFRNSTSQVRVLPEQLRTDLLRLAEKAIVEEGGFLQLDWRTYLFTARRSPKAV
ncbi:class I SAM-dependent methyltransferase [Streptomyces lavendofoliae]|uniref:class I SAM-dependent methyltransferase n=1 Tax=Streptomyces lavendofoliae TaxID=67314 RepID=UPI003D8A8625